MKIRILGLITVIVFVALGCGLLGLTAAADSADGCDMPAEGLAVRLTGAEYATSVGQPWGLVTQRQNGRFVIWAPGYALAGGEIIVDDCAAWEVLEARDAE